MNTIKGMEENLEGKIINLCCSINRTNFAVVDSTGRSSFYFFTK
jgi:hypothetical protein